MHDTGKKNSETTKGVSLLTGDPKKAIVRLSIPMIAAMLLLSTYNLADAVWVAGLGSDALAAVGFMTPIFMVLSGLAVGLGAGVSSAIARRVGAGDRAGADNTAVHAVLLALGLAAILTIPLILLAGPVAALLGAGEISGLAAEYGQTLFAGTVFVLFTNIAYAVLRAEGDTKRTMYAMGASSVLNIVLDPVFIYGAGMGVAGAALATVISIAAVSAVLVFWFLVKKDTYVSLSRERFSPD
ncbi:MATE family efflux transporter, partial [uncultured Methanofollis sp.]|uniref:MATE family efflux transporter n=1 Tax=uncultured Methanofollis sp. TaxID=262500 RepID=UPI00260D0488